MDSKIIIIYVFSLMMISCSSPSYNQYGSPDENIIGSRIEALSSSTNGFNQSDNNVLIFDQVTRKIKEFDLSNLSLIKSTEVKNPSANHSIIRPASANYLIDIADKTISVIDVNSQISTPDLGFQGKPMSASYNETNGYLVVYDDLSSVAILKISNQGAVLKSWLGGPVFSGKTISSGEILETGSLVLAMSDGTIALVDINQTLEQQTWVYTSFALSLGKISWIAQVKDNTSLVFVKSTDSSGGSLLGIVNVNTQAIVTQTSINYSINKLSKMGQAHALFLDGVSTKLIYATSLGTLETISLNRRVTTFIVSNLDLVTSSWEFIESNYSSQVIYSDWDDLKESRTFKIYRLSDMLVTKNIELPNEAQVRFSKQNLFYLFPSPLGYILKTSLVNGESVALKGFNILEL